MFKNKIWNRLSTYEIQWLSRNPEAIDDPKRILLKCTRIESTSESSAERQLKNEYDHLYIKTNEIYKITKQNKGIYG